MADVWTSGAVLRIGMFFLVALVECAGAQQSVAWPSMLWDVSAPTWASLPSHLNEEMAWEAPSLADVGRLTPEACIRTLTVRWRIAPFDEPHGCSWFTLATPLTRAPPATGLRRTFIDTQAASRSARGPGDISSLRDLGSAHGACA